jgi:hypothetical protein
MYCSATASLLCHRNLYLTIQSGEYKTGKIRVAKRRVTVWPRVTELARNVYIIGLDEKTAEVDACKIKRFISEGNIRQSKLRLAALIFSGGKVK